MDLKNIVGKIIKSTETYEEYMCITFDDDSLCVIAIYENYGDQKLKLTSISMLESYEQRALGIITVEECEKKEKAKRAAMKRFQEKSDLRKYELLKLKYEVKA
jgi:hypothetical protein